MQTHSHHALRLVTSLAAVWLLSSVPAAWAKDAPEPVTVDAAFNAADMAGKLTQVTEAATLKGITRVAVPQFSVQFVTFDTATAETSGFAAAGRARVTSSYVLKGVAEPDFQALTEALYTQFLQGLKASGLEVLPFAQVAAAPSYPKLVATGVVAPVREDSNIVVAPAGMALYGTNRAVATAPKKNAGVFGAFSGMGSVMSAIGSIGDVQALARELGDAALLEVHMVVNFVELTNNNKGFLGRLSNTASVDAKTSPSIASATMGVQAGAMRGTVTLAAPLALDAAAFTEVREQAKSTGEKAGMVAAQLLSIAIGSKDNSSYSTKEAVADPARYREVVGSGLGQVGQMFTARLKAER